MFHVLFIALVSEEAHAAPCARTSRTCDSDADGIVNRTETNLGLDPYDSDTDNDSLLDGREVNIYLTNALVPDTDGDGLLDGAEVDIHRTNPRSAHSDMDNITDGQEVNVYGTSPLLRDTDGDTLYDNDELFVIGTSPTLADTDGDGHDDAVDLFPTDSGDWADVDCDGIGDNADPDDNNNGVPDAQEWVGPNLSELVDLHGVLQMDFYYCPWLEWDPDYCEMFALEVHPGGLLVDTVDGYTGEYQEPATVAGVQVLIGFPTLDTTSERANGFQVDPGSYLACYEGALETLGGWSVLGGGSGFYWFESGDFTACVY